MATLNAATCFAVAGVQDPIWFVVAAGAFMGFLLHPDQDVDNGNITDYYIRDIHPLLEKVWDAYWFVYRKLIGHRSFWPHFPVVGTTIRVVYFFPALLAIKAYPPLALGLLIVDILHWMMDFACFRECGVAHERH